jgi:predicted Zn-dependent peptidase
MSVTVTKLANGVHVITDRMDTVETASVGAWVGVGARHEPAEINGITHLLEHMAFKGTERRSAQAISEEIEAVGGHLNAYTSRENTAFYAKVLKEDTALALDIVADIIQHAVIDPNELERERQVIIQEINQANDTPDDIIFDRFNEAAYPDQAIGRPVLGSAEIVGTVPRDTVLRYLRGEYAAPRIVVSAAGRVDHDAIVKLAEESFTALAPNGNATTHMPRYRGGELREERDLDQVQIVLGFDGLSYADPDYYALAVHSTLLGGGMSSRLFQEVREKRGLVYSIYSFAQSYEDGGLYGIYAGTGEDEVAEMIPLIAQEMLAVCNGVRPEEMQRARAQLKASTLMALESTSSRAEQAARQLQIYGRIIPVEETIAKIEEVDAAAVERVAARIVKSPLTLAAIGPTGGIEPYDAIAARFAAA